MGTLNETAFDHIKGNATFSVTAAEAWSIAMVHRLKKAYPGQVEIVHTNPDGSMLAHLPSEWMRVVPKRRDDRTDEERRALGQRLTAIRTQRTAVQGETGAISDE